MCLFPRVLLIAHVKQILITGLKVMDVCVLKHLLSILISL